MSYGTSSGNPGPSRQVDIHVQKKLRSLLEHLRWSYVALWSFNPQSRSLEWTGGHFTGDLPAQGNAEVWSIQLFNMQRTCTFTPGRGSVGVAYAERRKIWMNGRSVRLSAGSEMQARILEHARIETAVYIFSAETVLELGTSASVAEDMNFMNGIRDYMWEHILPALGHAQAPPHVSQSPLAPLLSHESHELLNQDFEFNEQTRRKPSLNIDDMFFQHPNENEELGITSSGYHPPTTPEPTWIPSPTTSPPTDLLQSPNPSLLVSAANYEALRRFQAYRSPSGSLEDTSVKLSVDSPEQNISFMAPSTSQRHNSHNHASSSARRETPSHSPELQQVGVTGIPGPAPNLHVVQQLIRQMLGSQEPRPQITYIDPSLEPRNLPDSAGFKAWRPTRGLRRRERSTNQGLLRRSFEILRQHRNLVTEDMNFMNGIRDYTWEDILHAQAPPHVSQSRLQSSTYSGSDRSSLVDEKVDFFSVCERIAHDIEEIVKRGNLLNERQCRDLSSKLLETVENMRAIKEFAGGSIFTPLLQILYQSLEKAKLLVSECAEEDWTAVAVFQVQNESSFEEILLEVWTCYKSIYDTATTAIPSIRGNISFRSSSWFGPASVSAIQSDEEDLRRRLERLASDPSSVKVFGYFVRKQEAQKHCLARHLLKKFSCTSQECLSSTSDVCKAGFWKKEIEPPGTWGNSKFLGAGSGASGVCRTQWLGVPCARKEFHGQASEVTFLKEASILSHLKHPRIVNFICCGNGEAKGDRFIAMELMEKSLFDVIEERQGVHFALPVAVDIIVQIAEGMRYLHDQGVAHRDLKPQNVVVNSLAFPHLVGQYYYVKLVDFGLSKTKVEVSKSDTISFRGIGTTRYRAPEVHPKAHLDGLGKAKWFRVDVYSFAMTCAHVLSLKAPFEDME